MATKKAPYGRRKDGKAKKKPGRKKGSTNKIGAMFGPIYDPSKAGKKRRGRKKGVKSVLSLKIKCGANGMPYLV